MADLAGQHGDLSAMMRIVGDQIAEKSGNIELSSVVQNQVSSGTHINSLQ